MPVSQSVRTSGMSASQSACGVPNIPVAQPFAQISGVLQQYSQVIDYPIFFIASFMDFHTHQFFLRRCDAIHFTTYILIFNKN